MEDFLLGTMWMVVAVYHNAVVFECSYVLYEARRSNFFYGFRK